MTDPRTGKRLALKKLLNVFQSVVSCTRVYRELLILCRLRHENVSLTCLPMPASIVSVCFPVCFPVIFGAICFPFSASIMLVGYLHGGNPGWHYHLYICAKSWTYWNWCQLIWYIQTACYRADFGHSEVEVTGLENVDGRCLHLSACQWSVLWVGYSEADMTILIRICHAFSINSARSANSVQCWWLIRVVAFERSISVIYGVSFCFFPVRDNELAVPSCWWQKGESPA